MIAATARDPIMASELNLLSISVMATAPAASAHVSIFVLSKAPSLNINYQPLIGKKVLPQVATVNYRLSLIEFQHSKKALFSRAIHQLFFPGTFFEPGVIAENTDDRKFADLIRSGQV
jgi:hypothetical protein